MTFLVIERFYPGKLQGIYERLEQSGRLLPKGLQYKESWIDRDLRVCYQVMESEREELLTTWINKWSDLAAFEVVPVLSSQQVKRKIREMPRTPANVNFSIRPVTLDDCDGVSTLLFESFREYRDLYTSKAFDETAITTDAVAHRIAEGPVWVAITEERITGTVSAVPRDTSLYIRGMAVHPAMRGRKIGLALLERVEDFARTKGYTHLRLCTTPYLEKAIRLYKQYGFGIVNEGPYHMYGTPLMTMVKSLK